MWMLKPAGDIPARIREEGLSLGKKDLSLLGFHALTELQPPAVDEGNNARIAAIHVRGYDLSEVLVAGSMPPGRGGMLMRSKAHL